MTHELLYTSAPRGLRPGSTGYCVVAQTDGIPRSLVEQLEALSTYRHARGDDGNPVAHVHATASAGGKTYHVLSRIADTGLDHTGRNNYLAHHIAIEADSLPRQGPAAACEELPFETAWDGHIGALPGRRVPSGSSEPQKCTLWEEATGDAGWAGVLAGATDPSEPAHIVYRPGQDLLPLLAEAMALLPVEDRWAVTFNTCFTKSGGVACQWRCVPTGSAEAKAAIAARRGVVLRLDHSSPGDAPTGRLVDAARTGVVPQRRTRTERAAEPPPAHRVARYEPPPPSYEVTDPESDPVPEPENDYAPEVAPRPRRRESAPAPVAAPPKTRGGGGIGQLLLGLAMGLVLALVLVAIVELGAKTSILGIAGMKSREDEQLAKVESAEKKTADLEKELKTVREQHQTNIGNIQGSQRNEVQQWAAEFEKEKKAKEKAERERDAEKSAKAQAERERDAANMAKANAERERDAAKIAAKTAVDDYIAKHKNDIPDGGGFFNVLPALKATRDELEKVKKELMELQNRVPPKGKDPAPANLTSKPIAIELGDKDKDKKLVTVRGEKPVLAAFGLPPKWEAKPTEGGGLIITAGDKTDGFRGELKIIDGWVTVSGEKLGKHPRLGSALIRVSTNAEVEYFHLTGPDTKAETNDTNKIRSPKNSEHNYQFHLDLGERLKTEYHVADIGQLKLGEKATVQINGREHNLTPEGNGGKVLAFHPNKPNNKMTPTVKLTLANTGKLIVEIDYPKDGKGAKDPPCKIVSADLVRQVGGQEKESVRQEVLRIRTP